MTKPEASLEPCGGQFHYDCQDLKSNATESKKIVELAALSAPLIPRLAELLDKTINVFEQIILLDQDHYKNDTDYLVNTHSLGTDLAQLGKEWEVSLKEIQSTWTHGAQDFDEAKARQATKSLIEVKKIIHSVGRVSRGQHRFATKYWRDLSYGSYDNDCKYKVPPPWDNSEDTRAREN